MAGSFPSSITAYTNPGPTDIIGVDVGARTHDEFHADNNDDLEAVMNKLGGGASVPGGVPGVLRSSAGGSTWGEIVNADVAAAAGILVSKLSGMGTPNRVAATADGTTVAMQQIATAMLATDAVTNAEVRFGGTNPTTNATSYADMDAANMSVSYVSSGGGLIVFAHATVENNTAGDYVTLGVSINGVDWGGTSFRATSSGYYGTVMVIAMETLAAGTYVIKPRWRIGNAANLGTSYSGSMKMLILELKR